MQAQEVIFLKLYSFSPHTTHDYRKCKNTEESNEETESHLKSHKVRFTF